MRALQSGAPPPFCCRLSDAGFSPPPFRFRLLVLLDDLPEPGGLQDPDGPPLLGDDPLPTEFGEDPGQGRPGHPEDLGELLLGLGDPQLRGPLPVHLRQEKTGDLPPDGAELQKPELLGQKADLGPQAAEHPGQEILADPAEPEHLLPGNGDDLDVRRRRHRHRQGAVRGEEDRRGYGLRGLEGFHL